MNRQFTKEELQMANRYFSIRLNDLKETQIQSPLNMHITYQDDYQMNTQQLLTRMWRKGTITPSAATTEVSM